MVNQYDVILPTWNGAKYLWEQLDSIACQTLLPSRIWIADDGSSDQTMDTLSRWKSNSDLSINVLPRLPQRLGSCKSFERLMYKSSSPYLMLADQDDVWDATKAERMLHKMLSLETQHGMHKPLLVHTDLRLIDAAGHPLSSSFFKYQKINPRLDHWLEIALQNIVTGCACLINRECISQALPFPPEVVLHDWWLALVAARQGAIGFLPEASVSYRQHGNNLVGASGLHLQLLWRLFQLLDQKSMDSWIGPCLRQLYAVQRRFPVHDPVIDLAFEHLFSSSPFLRFFASLRLGLAKHGLLRTSGFYLALLFWNPGAINFK